MVYLRLNTSQVQFDFVEVIINFPGLEDLLSGSITQLGQRLFTVREMNLS